MDVNAAATFAATAITLLMAHNVAEHWGQTDRQAAMKGGHDGELVDDWGRPPEEAPKGARLRTRSQWGWRACLTHVTAYVAITAGSLAVVWALFELSISATGFLLGQLVSASTHYWADRCYTLQRLVDRLPWLRKFYTLGRPRPGHDDNPSLGTGAYVLDQSWHHAWILVTAVLTATI